MPPEACECLGMLGEERLRRPGGMTGEVFHGVRCDTLSTRGVVPGYPLLTASNDLA